MLERDWLTDQFEEVEREVSGWPAWLRRETGLAETRQMFDNTAQLPEMPIGEKTKRASVEKARQQAAGSHT